MINNYIEHLSPKKVYIPLTDNKARLANVKVAVGDSVKVGTLLAEKYAGKNKCGVYSSVSGKVVGVEEREDVFGNKVDHIVIENNNKEEKETLGALGEGDLKERLQALGVKEQSLDPAFTGLVHEDVKEVFVVVAFPNEPLVKSDYSFLKDNASNVVKGSVLLAKSAGLERVNILVSKNVPEEIYKELGNCADFVIRTFRVCTCDIGYIYKAVQKITEFKVSPNKFSGAEVVSVATALAVANAAEVGLPTTSRAVALSGNALNEEVCIITKIGTPISELVELAGGLKDIRLSGTIGRVYNGLPLASLDVVVTENVNAIHFEEAKEEEEAVYNRSGLANDACPIGLLPEHVIQALELKDDHKLHQLGVLNCNECGKCAYVEPNGINLLEIMRRAKRRLQ